MGLTDINSVRRGQDDEEADSEERDQLQFSNGASVSEIRRFEIAFDRPEALYFSGDCVSGEVQISLEDTIHVKGVVVRFIGEAYVNVPLEEEGHEGLSKGAAMWQKRCRNLRTFASRGRRNKVKPAAGMSNHGFANAETKIPDIKVDGATPAPQANGGHAIKCESADDLTDVVSERTGDKGSSPKELRTEKGGSPEHVIPAGSEHLQPPSLETVKEEREEELERSLDEVRLGAGEDEAAAPAHGDPNGGGEGEEAGPEAAVMEAPSVPPPEKPPDEGDRPPGAPLEETVAPLTAKTKEVNGEKEASKVSDSKGEKGKKGKEQGSRKEERRKAAPTAASESSGKKSSGAPRRPHAMAADQSGGAKRRMAAKIRSHEKYFDYKYYVFGHKYSSAREHLSSGAHRFRFSYVLPGKLPSSFHGRYGYVRYFCEASLERAWAASITRKCMFSVSASVDVNREPRAESGAGGHRSTHGCLFCCPRGTVMAEAGVRRRGFVPGERIPLRAHILNVSDRCVKRTRARLMQVVTYHSTSGGRSKVDEVVVREAARGQVPRGEADTWDEEAKGHCPQPPVSIEIPPLPANFKCSEFCKIIDVDYRLDFVVEVEGEPEPLHIRMPIVVGTVPLERVFRTMEMGPRRRSTASAAEKMEGPSPIIIPGSPQYLEFPLPRFEQCNWGPRHVEAYFHHEVTRKLNDEDETTPTAETPGGGGVGAAAKATKAVTPVAMAGALPGVGSTLRVHRKGETFAPRYVCYKLKDPDAMANHEGGSNVGIPGGRTSMGELSLSPLSPSHLKGIRSPSEAWIPRDTSETELVSPAGGPSGKGKRS
ncbi:uncharacterized protein LOC124166919 [Ischnura elegans]|uniref:uncharacterized protein LOC124166919 n=1 Tax=Ischnura elegans TaxID=197161 RepID=UPI001ED89FBA|nr:uncharacterized protein LOC124166919 [Ischnura elegans]